MRANEPRKDLPKGETSRTEPAGKRDAAAEVTTPSWFSKTYPNEKPLDLADRYRAEREADPVVELPGPEAYEAYRRRLEGRFQAAKRLADAAPVIAEAAQVQPPTRQVLPPSDPDGNRRFHEWENKVRRHHAPPLEKQSRFSPLRLTSFLLGACAVGGLAGFAAANRSLIDQWLASAGGQAQAAVAGLVAEETPLEPVSRETVLTKKPVKIARVDVNDVSGQLNGPIALDIAAFPADEQTPVSLKISGLPEQAYLTKGTEIADGQWLLKPTDIANAKLVVPRYNEPELALEVAAVEEKTGNLAAPAKEMKVVLDVAEVKVVPVNALPDQGFSKSAELPAAASPPQEAANSDALGLMSKGEALLKSGDIVSARQFFLKAHELGLTEGTYGVGRTYDPVVYVALNVRGLKADRDKALEWYGKAVESGSEPAQAALEVLNGTPQL